MSLQNPLNQVERLHPECYIGRHIINIAHACRLELFGHIAKFSCDIPASNILIICCASRDGHPTILPGGAQMVDLEPPGFVTSVPTLACLWPIHFLWHKIVRSGGQSLRPQRLCNVTDYSTYVPVQSHLSSLLSCSLIPRLSSFLLSCLHPPLLYHKSLLLIPITWSLQ